MQHSVEVGLFLGTDAVATDLTVSDGLEVHGIDYLVDRQLVWQVGLVTQHEEWDAIQGGLVHQLVQFFCGDWQGCLVSRVYDISDHRLTS